MSVYTQLTHKQFDSILSQYNLGRLDQFEGIAAGIENTNYKITLNTASAQTQYFLTIFEQLEKDALNYFIPLLAHLKSHGCLLPAPKANLHGHYLFEVGDKYGVIFECLSGHHLDAVKPAQAHAIGQELANIHQSAQDFGLSHANPRGFYWLQKQAVNPELNIADDDRTLLQQTLKILQGHWHQWNDKDLLQSFIHGDLFIDNCLFLESGELSGVIDFYAGGLDYCAYDLAICIMAWGNTQQHKIDQTIADAIIKGYESVRQLSDDEKHELPNFLQLAVLRFWVSRLIAQSQQQDATLTTHKNPEDMKQLLINLTQ